MLYDQAQLAISYLEAYQITKDPAFADVARDILEYVLRDMRGPEGGFYSAQDADSLIEQGRPEHAEGAFYVWSADQIRQILGEQRAAIFEFHYGVIPAGNVPVQQDARGELKGKNVLIVRHTYAEDAARFGTSEAEIRAVLASARRELSAARSNRPHPPLDDKVLVSWNGLMISAFARAAQVLDEARYAEAARASAAFIESRMYDQKTGLLERRYREGRRNRRVVEDYAFLIQGLVDLCETSFDVKWLSGPCVAGTTGSAVLGCQGCRIFRHTRRGRARSGAHERQLRRPRNLQQLCSGDGICCHCGEVTDRQAWRDKADATFAAFAVRLGTQGTAVPQLGAALDFSLSKPKQVVIAGEPGAADTKAMLRLVHERFIPNKVLLLADGAGGQDQLIRWLPVIGSITRRNGQATAYICEDYVCQLPTTDLGIAAQLLDGTWNPDSKR
jgi:uncharacterized protein YyaL (SSP411 family)